MFEQRSGYRSPPEVIAYFDELFERHYPSRTPVSTGLLERIGAAARAENRAAAAQLTAIGELFGYRLSRCAETESWAVDTEAAVSAEVAAELPPRTDVILGGVPMEPRKAGLLPSYASEEEREMWRRQPGVRMQVCPGVGHAIPDDQLGPAVRAALAD